MLVVTRFRKRGSHHWELATDCGSVGATYRLGGPIEVDLLVQVYESDGERRPAAKLCMSQEEARGLGQRLIDMSHWVPPTH